MSMEDEPEKPKTDNSINQFQSINLFSQLCKITNWITTVSEKHSDGLPEKQMLV